MVKKNQLIDADNLSELSSLTHLLDRNDDDDCYTRCVSLYIYLYIRCLLHYIFSYDILSSEMFVIYSVIIVHISIISSRKTNYI